MCSDFGSLIVFKSWLCSLSPSFRFNLCNAVTSYSLFACRHLTTLSMNVLSSRSPSPTLLVLLLSYLLKWVWGEEGGFLSAVCFAFSLSLSLCVCVAWIFRPKSVVCLLQMVNCSHSNVIMRLLCVSLCNAIHWMWWVGHLWCPAPPKWCWWLW